MEVKNDYEAFKEPWEEFLRKACAPIAKQELEVLLEVSVWDVLFEQAIVKRRLRFRYKDGRDVENDHLKG